MLSENSIIQVLRQHFPARIGDDAAIFPYSKTKSYVISKDLFLEDTHFRTGTKTISPQSLAHKALHVNLSDLAAMGATPRYILLGVSVPKHYGTQINRFLNAFAKACKTAEVELIGGDTTGSTNKVFISITAIGIASTQSIKYRHKARPGDYICTLGNLGYAHLGFLASEQESRGLHRFKQSLHRPCAEVQAGFWLGRQRAVHAMMDLSDGFYTDLSRLCVESKVAADVHLDLFIPKHSLLSACKKLEVDPIHTQLSGAEDYGLLLTVHPKHYDRLTRQLSQKLGKSLVKRGEIKKGHRIHFFSEGKKIKLNLKNFTHFGEKSALLHH